jgi:hypothetical protein
VHATIPFRLYTALRRLAKGENAGNIVGSFSSQFVHEIEQLKFSFAALEYPAVLSLSSDVGVIGVNSERMTHICGVQP